VRVLIRDSHLLYHAAVSVLQTQRPVAELQAEIAQARLRLAEMKKRLVPLIEKHRAQIKKSLCSSDETERKMAEAVANWWQVTKV